MIEREFATDGVAMIELGIPAGRIEIREGREGVVKVIAEGKTDDLLVAQRGSVVVIETKNRGFLSSGRFRIVVDTPSGSDVVANVASADLQVEVPLSRLEVKSASGDVRFTDVGELSARTASGDVNGSSVGGCSFVSASGDLHLGNVTGKAETSTASGDIRIDSAGDEFQSSTISGDLSVRSYHGARLKAKGVSGSVRLGIPAGTAVDLDAVTRTGDIRLPKPSDQQGPSTGHAGIEVRLVSGDLVIDRV